MSAFVSAMSRLSKEDTLYSPLNTAGVCSSSQPSSLRPSVAPAAALAGTCGEPGANTSSG